MLQGYNTFREYVEYLEGSTINPLTSAPGMTNPNKAIDDEIAKNPNVVTSKLKTPQAQKTFMTAIMSRRSNPNVSISAQISGQQMANRMNSTGG
jgi:hypothetical protein